MFATISPLLLLYGVITFLVLHAAWTDWTAMKILNNTNIAIVCAAVVKYLMMPETFGWLDPVYAIGLFAFGVVVLHMLLKFGPGDIKFMGAIALWFGEEHTLTFALLAGIFGGVLALAHMLVLIPLNRVDPWGVVERVVPFLKIGGGKTIPYGVGMAAAALILLFWDAQILKVL